MSRTIPTPPDDPHDHRRRTASRVLAAVVALAFVPALIVGAPGTAGRRDHQEPVRRRRRLAGPAALVRPPHRRRLRPRLRAHRRRRAGARLGRRRQGRRTQGDQGAQEARARLHRGPAFETRPGSTPAPSRSCSTSRPPSMPTPATSAVRDRNNLVATLRVPGVRQRPPCDLPGSRRRPLQRHQHVRRLQQHDRPVARPDRARAHHEEGAVEAVGGLPAPPAVRERRFPTRDQHRRLHRLGRRDGVRRAGPVGRRQEEGDRGRTRRRRAGSSATSTATGRSPATACATRTRPAWRGRHCSRPDARRPRRRPTQFIRSLQVKCGGKPANRGKVRYAKTAAGDPIRATSQAVPALAGCRSGRDHQVGRDATSCPSCAAPSRRTAGSIGRDDKAGPR